MAKPSIACVEERPLDGLFDFNFTLSALEDVSQHLSRRIAPRFLPFTVTGNNQKGQQQHQQRQQIQAYQSPQQAERRQQHEQAQQNVDQQHDCSQEGAKSDASADAGAACGVPLQHQDRLGKSSGRTSLHVHSDNSNASTAVSATEYVFEYTCPPQGPSRRSSVPPAWQGTTEKDRDSHKVWGDVRHRFFSYKPKSFEPPALAGEIDTPCDAQHQQTRGLPAPTGTLTGAGTATKDSRLSKCCAATQSIYREQETQTIPYSPAVVIPASQHPEEITISHLCWQNGLPATQFEVAIIQKMRQKRKIEQLLPPATDEFSFHLRSALMEEQEFREWAEREQQLKQLQERRLELFREALRSRAASALRREEEVLSRTENRLKEGRLLFALKKEKQRLRFMRNIWREKLQLEEYLNPTRWKAIANSCSRSSPLYAPKSMNGYIADDPYSSLNLDRLPLKDYSELVELEKSVDESQYPKSCSSKKKTTYKQKAEARLKQALDNTALRLRQEAVREQASKDTGSTTGLEVPTVLLDAAAASPQHIRETHAAAMKKMYMRIIRERPETPRVEETLPEDEELQVAVILLQRVLRGQACQQRMFEGKEKRLDLINFLRASEQLCDIPVEEQEALAAKETKQELFQVLTATFQGYAIAQTLDELSKELRKVQEERRIAAMVALAERDRRLREAQESGTRQAEELLRLREDEAFRRIMTIHQQTVDSYVESILASTVDHVAQQQALVEARERAERLSRVTDAVEEKYKDPLQVSRELMLRFLLPHVKKQQLQRQLRQEEEKFTLAVRYGVEESFRMLRPQQSSLF